MKPGSRPFGCCLLVACLGGGMYRIDPSGAVTELESTVYLGRGDGKRIVQRLEEEVVVSDGYDDTDVDGLDEAERILIKILGEEMGLVDGDSDGDREESAATIVCTQFSRKGGCVTKRIHVQ